MTAKPLTMRNGLPSNNINQALRGRRGDIWLGTNEGLVHVPDVATLKNIEVFNAQKIVKGLLGGKRSERYGSGHPAA